MSKYYTVIYNGVELYGYAMSDAEKLVAEGLRQELIGVCNALDVPREKCFDGSLYMGRLKDNDGFYLKYGNGIGYFVLEGERGVYSLMEGFPTGDREEAKCILLTREFLRGGLQHELALREELQKEWTQKYSVEYDSRKAGFEYAIRMLNTVFHDFPEDVVSEYSGYMNKWFSPEHWYFDRDSMSFEEL